MSGNQMTREQAEAIAAHLTESDAWRVPRLVTHLQGAHRWYVPETGFTESQLKRWHRTAHHRKEE